MNLIDEMQTYRGVILNESFNRRPLRIIPEPTQHQPSYFLVKLGVKELGSFWPSAKMPGRWECESFVGGRGLMGLSTITAVIDVFYDDANISNRPDVSEVLAKNNMSEDASDYLPSFINEKMDNKKTAALKKKEHQLTLAIRAKQKNKWGSIKESVPTGSMPLGNGGERIITSHSGDKFRVPSEKEVIEYRNAVKNKDWDKVQNFEENWELIDESKVTPGPFSKKGKLKEGYEGNDYSSGWTDAIKEAADYVSGAGYPLLADELKDNLLD